MPRFDDERPGPSDKKGSRDRAAKPGAEPESLIDAPPTEDELRAAAALRRALGDGGDEPSPTASAGAGTAGPAPVTAERRWLAAHLRVPTAEDSLGEVRAWRLARAARESVAAKRLRAAQRSGGWSRLGRSLTSTGGLLAAAALLLIVSWLIVGQNPAQNPGQGTAELRRPANGSTENSAPTLRAGRAANPPGRAVQGLMWRDSFNLKESPAQRLELMIQARMAELRGAAADGERGVSGRSLAAGAVSMGHGVMP